MRTVPEGFLEERHLSGDMKKEQEMSRAKAPETGSLGQEEEGGVQIPERSECPVGEREWGIWGWGAPCYPFPEARLQRDHAAVAAPLAVGDLSLALLS